MRLTAFFSFFLTGIVLGDALLDRDGRAARHHRFHLNDRRVGCLVANSSSRFLLGVGCPASCTLIKEFLKQLCVPVVCLEEKVANVTNNGYQSKLDIQSKVVGEKKVCINKTNGCFFPFFLFGGSNNARRVYAVRKEGQ